MLSFLSGVGTALQQQVLTVQWQLWEGQHLLFNLQQHILQQQKERGQLKHGTYRSSSLYTTDPPGLAEPPTLAAFPDHRTETARILGPPFHPRLLCNILPLIRHAPSSAAYILSVKFNNNSPAFSTILSPHCLSVLITACCFNLWRDISFLIAWSLLYNL